MRQNPQTETTASPSHLKLLHPVLSQALANLDIQLEDELARYRRQRVSATRPARPSGRKSASSMLDLIAVSATSGKTESPQGETLAAKLPERSAGSMEPAIDTAYKPTPAFAASARPIDSAIALRTPDRSSLSENDASETTLAAEASGDHTIAQSTNPNLDDYLESSEELLRSLATEEAEVRAERSFMQGLLTPLGLGSMLLLLLSSAMFGYVIMNPSSLGRFIVWRGGGVDSSGVSATGQSPIQGAKSLPEPNLANPALPNVSLNNLGTLDATPNSPTSSGAKAPLLKAKPTDAAKPTVATPQPGQESSASTGQAPLPAVTSSVNRPAPIQTYTPPQAATPARSTALPLRSAPTPTYRAPSAPKSTPVAAAPANRSPASDAYPIKVVTHYDGDAALKQSQTVVPDAYLRNFRDGAKIQLGAYSDATTAAAKAQELRSRGIPAEVYKP